MELEIPPLPEKARRYLSPASIVFLCLTGVVFLFTVFCLIKVAPTFADVFDSFGASLPWNTSFIVWLGRTLEPSRNPFGLPVFIWALVLILGLVQWRSLLGSRTALWMFLFSIFFLLFIVVALFTPMFMLGNAVQN
jgi:type II secretory pathway component PulF